MHKSAAVYDPVKIVKVFSKKELEDEMAAEGKEIADRNKDLNKAYKSFEFSTGAHTGKSKYTEWMKTAKNKEKLDEYLMSTAKGCPSFSALRICQAKAMQQMFTSAFSYTCTPATLSPGLYTNGKTFSTLAASACVRDQVPVYVGPNLSPLNFVTKQGRLNAATVKFWKNAYLAVNFMTIKVAACKRVSTKNGQLHFDGNGVMSCTTRKTVEVRAVCLLRDEPYPSKATWKSGQKYDPESMVCDRKLSDHEKKKNSEERELGEAESPNTRFTSAMAHMAMDHALEALHGHLGAATTAPDGPMTSDVKKFAEHLDQLRKHVADFRRASSHSKHSPKFDRMQKLVHMALQGIESAQDGDSIGEMWGRRRKKSKKKRKSTKKKGFFARMKEKAKSVASKAKSMASKGLFSFESLLGKACKMAGSFKMACEAVLSVVRYLTEMKNLKSSSAHSKGVPCNGHPETFDDGQCVARLRQLQCLRLPIIFSQMSIFFSCRKMTSSAKPFQQMAQRSSQFFCNGKKYDQCWQKKHRDFTWCDGVGSLLSAKRANGFRDPKKGKVYYQKKHPYAKHVGLANKTFKYVKMPMKPSKEVFKSWCADLPPALMGYKVRECCCPHSNDAACHRKCKDQSALLKVKANVVDGSTIPAAWTSDNLIGS